MRQGPPGPGPLWPPLPAAFGRSHVVLREGRDLAASSAWQGQPRRGPVTWVLKGALLEVPTVLWSFMTAALGTPPAAWPMGTGWGLMSPRPGHLLWPRTGESHPVLAVAVGSPKSVWGAGSQRPRGRRHPRPLLLLVATAFILGVPGLGDASLQSQPLSSRGCHLVCLSVLPLLLLPLRCQEVNPGPRTCEATPQ